MVAKEPIRGIRTLAKLAAMEPTDKAAAMQMLEHAYCALATPHQVITVLAALGPIHLQALELQTNAQAVGLVNTWLVAEDLVLELAWHAQELPEVDITALAVLGQTLELL